MGPHRNQADPRPRRLRRQGRIDVEPEMIDLVDQASKLTPRRRAALANHLDRLTDEQPDDGEGDHHAQDD